MGMCVAVVVVVGLTSVSERVEDVVEPPGTSHPAQWERGVPTKRRRRGKEREREGEREREREGGTRESKRERHSEGGRRRQRRRGYVREKRT